MMSVWSRGYVIGFKIFATPPFPLDQTGFLAFTYQQFSYFTFISSRPFSVLLRCPMGSKESSLLRPVYWPLKPSSPNWSDRPITPLQKKNPFLRSASERPYEWLSLLSSNL